MLIRSCVDNFHYQPIEFSDNKAIAFSTGSLSKEGKEGLHQLLEICDLIETYNVGERTNARTYI